MSPEEILEDLVKGYCQVHYLSGRLFFCFTGLGEGVSDNLVANSPCCTTFCLE